MGKRVSHPSLPEKESTSLDEKHLKTIANSPVWHALLHFDGRESRIRDKDFLLSVDQFNPALELRQTLRFFSKNPLAYCRFPARYYWLKNYFSFPDNALAPCSELLEFEKRAPADTLALVFASENISQPSSMMGHVLLKMSGVNHVGSYVNHAISFYTDVQGVNLPKLFYDSILVGKKGFFSLTPYQPKLDRYRGEEGRNVWEYSLRLTGEQRKLIQYHIYELKETDLTYYFDDYNCATLTQFLIGLTGALPQKPDIFWTTPLDTVKLAKEKELIASINLIPADRWKIKMLNDVLLKKNRSVVRGSVKDPSVIRTIGSPEQRFIAYEIAESFARMQFKSSEINHEQFARFNEKVAHDRKSDPEFTIDISKYKSPINTPKDSQLGLGLFHSLNENFIKVDVLPTAHRLEDDNSQYFAETELTLGEISVIHSLDTNTQKIHHFTLYGVKSLMPRDSFSKGLSGSFKLGSNLQIYSDMKQHSQVYVEGSIGNAYEAFKSFIVYGLVGGGLGKSRIDDNVYAQLELGFVLRPTKHSKSRIYTHYMDSNSENIPVNYRLALEQSFFISESWSSILTIDRVHAVELGTQGKKAADTSVSLSLKYLF